MIRQARRSRKHRRELAGNSREREFGLPPSADYSRQSDARAAGGPLSPVRARLTSAAGKGRFRNAPAEICSSVVAIEQKK